MNDQPDDNRETNKPDEATTVAVSGNAANAPNGSVLLTVAKGGIWLFVAVLAVAALAWFLAAPKGELRLALDPSIRGQTTDGRDKTELAAELFQQADSLVDEAQEFHERVSLVDPNSPVPLLAMPPTQAPADMGYKSLITSFVIETSIDQQSGRVALSINGVAFLEFLYGAVGWHDYFLAISDINSISCDPPQAESSCYQIRASFSPSPLRIEPLRGTVEEIARDLAVLVLRGVVLDNAAVWEASNKDTNSREPYLFAPSTTAHGCIARGRRRYRNTTDWRRSSKMRCS